MTSREPCFVRLSLTAFLLRPNTLPREALSESARGDCDFYQWAAGSVTAIPDVGEILRAAQPGDIVVTVLRRLRSAPPWQRFLRDALELDVLGIGGQSVGAFVFCAVSQRETDDLRWLAWTFGSAAHSIDRRRTDARFGLLVTLNTLAEAITEGRTGAGRTPQLRTINYRTTGPFFQQTGTRAAKDIPVSAFRFDQQSDLVSGAGGHTGDQAVPVVFGGRSLSFTTEVADLPELADLAELLVARAQERRYRESYGWVDNITLVSEPDRVAALRGSLATLLVESPVPRNVDALLPDDYPEYNERAIEYVAFPRERVMTASRVNLTIDRIGQLAQRCDSAVDVLDLPLRFLDADRSEIVSATVIECVCSELVLDASVFIAYEGDFFEVEPRFVAGVDAEIREIEMSGLALPAYRGGSEPQYFEDVQQEAADRLLVVDRGLLRLGTERGGIEAADLLAPEGAIIHVKRKGKSSVLSHLFFQAGNSADVLRRSLDARSQLQELIANSDGPAELRDAVGEAFKDPTGSEVTFAVLGDWRDRDATALPLFTKISLVQAVRRIRLLGYRPTLALVSSAEDDDADPPASSHTAD